MSGLYRGPFFFLLFPDPLDSTPADLTIPMLFLIIFCVEIRYVGSFSHPAERSNAMRIILPPFIAIFPSRVLWGYCQGTGGTFLNPQMSPFPSEPEGDEG